MKKIKQWFFGLVIAMYGVAIGLCFVGVVASFGDMMNSVGVEFVGNFIMFVICLTFTVFLPYICFHQMKDVFRTMVF